MKHTRFTQLIDPTKKLDSSIVFRFYLNILALNHIEKPISTKKFNYTHSPITFRDFGIPKHTS